MYKNIVKEMLLNKQPILGCTVNGPYPELIEILGLAGFHFVFIDAEHSTLSFRECEELVRAAELRHIVPFIRTPENNPKTILRYMDLGAMGMIIPDVGSKEDADAAVRAVKYAPRGDRGLASTRSQDFGYVKSKSEYFKAANSETMVIVLIESKEGVDRAEEILAVDGVDACFIGTSDLSMSLGVLGQVDHPLVQSAFNRVLNLGIQMGKPVGVIVRENESPKQLLDKGLSMVFTGINSLVKTAAKDFITKAGC